MVYPHLSESTALTERGIDGSKVRTSPGVYVLGPAADGGSILARYVGRSDTDLKAHLKKHIGAETHFVFAHKTSPMAAFASECELFHHLNPLRNKVHPRRPRGTVWKCPWCNG